MTASDRTANIEAALSFTRAVEAGDASALDGYFAPDARQTEQPNAFRPTGDIRDLAAMKAGIEHGKGLIGDQRYDILNTIADDTHVVLEMHWHGTVLADLPPLNKGQTLSAHCVAVFDFDGGKVTRLRNYDCFDPLAAS